MFLNMALPVKDAGLFTKKSTKETVTIHRLTVAILIHDYCNFRKSSVFLEEIPEKERVKYRRSFCLLALRLLQSPDLTLPELRTLLYSKVYDIHPTFIMNYFEKTLAKLNDTGTDYLLDIIENFNKLMNLKDASIPDLSKILVNRSSTVGYFFRRLVVYLDNLSFSELTVFLRDFRKYYTPVEDVDSIFEQAKDKPKLEDWFGDKEKWTRRQAELFIATQAAILASNEEKALTPPELSKHLKNILKSNPDLAEAHFLSYLNYLRVKEFCGAIDSLYHCFDKGAVVADHKPVDETSKGYRYAALNLAVLHYHFDHRDEAFAALKECVKLAQEANDNVCLQHALSWLHCIAYKNKDKLVEHSILKSLELNMSYTMSFGIQCFVQYAGITSGNPKKIFDTITKSDIINCEHNHTDLISNSYMEKSSLWLLYGKSQMSSMWSQLFLHLNTDSTMLNNTIYGEGFCKSICNVANHLLLEGEYEKTNLLLSLARKNFPNEPVSHNWILSENVLQFTRSLYNENFTAAEAAARNLIVIDKWESYLRLAECYLFKADFQAAHSCISHILDNCQSKTGEKLRIDLHVRALILLAEIQAVSNLPETVPPGVVVLLNSCLSYAQDYHLDYYAALTQLHMANVQFLMGMPAQALKLLDRCLATILAHGGSYDRARAMYLYIKCWIGNAKQPNQEKRRREIIIEGTKMLEKVKDNFAKVEAHSRVLAALYFQSQLYHEVGFRQERNDVCREFLMLEKERPMKNYQLVIKYV